MRPENISTSVHAEACLTEVVMAHKRGNIVCISAPSDTGTWSRSGITIRVVIQFIKTCSKGPDVLTGGAVCHTDSINVEGVDRPSRSSKSLWKSTLEAYDPATNLAVLLTTSGVVYSLTARRGRSFPTHPVWGGDLLPNRGAVLGGVRHVEVGYTSPAR